MSSSGIPTSETPAPETPERDDITQLLRRWSEGDGQAADLLVPIIHHDLARRAKGYLRREREDHTLETEALVNEAYLRLVDQSRVSWRDRNHFYAIAAQAMRRILVDHARKRGFAKRGGGVAPLELDESLVGRQRPEELVALDEALGRLEIHDAQKAAVVEMRFFGGLSHPEIAEVLDTSLSTVERHWRMARAWLHRELGQGSGQ
jgi:RNA polymerase sigma factor (TIGR02999 family)